MRRATRACQETSSSRPCRRGRREVGDCLNSGLRWQAESATAFERSRDFRFIWLPCALESAVAAPLGRRCTNSQRRSFSRAADYLHAVTKARRAGSFVATRTTRIKSPAGGDIGRGCRSSGACIVLECASLKAAAPTALNTRLRLLPVRLGVWPRERGERSPHSPTTPLLRRPVAVGPRVFFVR